jgi:hypothetical protein
MRKNNTRTIFLVAALILSLVSNAFLQGRNTTDIDLAAKRFTIEKELQEIAVVDRKVMVPMPDLVFRTILWFG